MILSSLQQSESAMMEPGHSMGNQNQDILLLYGFILLILLILVITIVGSLIYFYYTGSLSFKRRKNENDESLKIINSETHSFTRISLPDVTLSPLERKVLETVISGHKIKQSDLPGLLNASKSKISESLSNLEKQRIIERYKSGRSLEIRYVYELPHPEG